MLMSFIPATRASATTPAAAHMCMTLKNGVAFGASMPGVDNRMHRADEFAYVGDLVASAKIFAQVIADLCK